MLQAFPLWPSPLPLRSLLMAAWPWRTLPPPPTPPAPAPPPPPWLRWAAPGALGGGGCLQARLRCPAAAARHTSPAGNPPSPTRCASPTPRLLQATAQAAHGGLAIADALAEAFASGGGFAQVGSSCWQACLGQRLASCTPPLSPPHSDLPLASPVLPSSAGLRPGAGPGLRQRPRPAVPGAGHRAGQRRRRGQGCPGLRHRPGPGPVLVNAPEPHSTPSTRRVSPGLSACPLALPLVIPHPPTDLSPSVADTSIHLPGPPLPCTRPPQTRPL